MARVTDTTILGLLYPFFSSSFVFPSATITAGQQNGMVQQAFRGEANSGGRLGKQRRFPAIECQWDGACEVNFV